MQVQQLTEINPGKTKQPEAKNNVNAAQETRRDSEFKQQLNKQVDHSRQQNTNEKKLNNQSDSSTAAAQDSADSEPRAWSDDMPIENQQSLDGRQETDTSNSLGMDIEEKLVDFAVQTDDANLDSTLPLQGNSLPSTEVLKNIEGEIVSSANLARQGGAASTTVEEPVTIAEQFRSAKALNQVAVSQNPVGQVPSAQEAAFNSQAAYKAVTLTERAAGPMGTGGMDRQGPVMGEMPTSELMTQSTRLQQVPLTTAINATVANPQSVNVHTVSGTEFTSALNTASTTTASTLNTAITTSLQSPQWSQKVTEQVSFMLKGGLQQAEIKLNPAHLGPMEIKLTMNDDQASVNFVAQHAPVREALDAAIPRLREMLEQQGLNLADVDVSTQSQQQQAEGEGSSQGEVAKAESDETGEQVNTQHITVNMTEGSGVSIFA